MSTDETDGIWANGVPELRPGESRVSYAHLMISDLTDETPGTLFLTDQRVIFRAVDDTGTFTSSVVAEEVDQIRLGWPRRGSPGEFLLATRRGRTEQAWGFRPRPGSSADEAQRIFHELEEAEPPAVGEP